MASQTAMTASTAVTEQGVSVPTPTAQGVKTCAPVGECVPSLQEIESFVIPRLKEHGITRAFLEGEFVRASKWGDARRSDELRLVLFSDEEFKDLVHVRDELAAALNFYIKIKIWETDSILPEESLNDFAFSRYSDWKVLKL